MLITPALFIGLVVALVGALIFWSNPGRQVNRLVFTSSLHIAAWLLCLHMATRPGGDGLFWFRNAHAVTASFPLHCLLVKEAILGTRFGLQLFFSARMLAWMAATAFFTVIPLTYYFVPAHSTAANPVYGWGYTANIYGVRLLYCILLFDVIRSLRRAESSKRVELQVWLLGGCAMAAGILVAEALHVMTGNRSFVRIQPWIALLFCLGTGYAITTARLFDARQLFKLFIARVGLVLLVAGIAFAVDRTLVLFVREEGLAFVLTTGLTLWIASVLNTQLNSLLNIYPQATGARQAAHQVAREILTADRLQPAFLEIVKGWAQTDRAVLLSGSEGPVEGHGIVLQRDSDVLRAIKELQWVAPERLSRERATPERDAMREFLRENNLGLLVQGQGAALTVLVGVGMPASRRPFTYPQVTQLQELTSIIETALERAHFSMKAQHAEQLATVGMLGAGLAHEIRNPLVTIKTFVQLLPQHYGDAAFRTKFFRLISDEVTRIDRLTEQLLDMASPRVYEAQAMPLHPLLRTSLELVAAKAADRKIRIIVDFAANPDTVLTDGSAAKQVLLNLALNSIHAVENIAGERWIRVATRNVEGAVEMALSDNGPGISEEIMPRLFQPFQSTKSSGFGLGLAICKDILTGLKATIAADQPRPGVGATFRVNFPCPPPSS